MSRTQRLISAFVVFHLCALAICAIPVPDELPRQVPVDRSGQIGLRRAAPLLDTLARYEVAVDRALWALVQPIRRPFWLYMRATRQTPQWNMFFRPPEGDNYIALKYYLAAPGSSMLTVYKELIFPTHPGGRFRAVRAYSASFRDKAIDNTYQAYYTRLERELKRTDLAHAAASAQVTVLPVIQAFGRRFAARNLAPGERLTRVELWRALAPLPRPGESSDAATRNARQDILDKYDGVSGEVVPTSRAIPLRASMREADIVWTLLGRMEWK